MKTSQAEHETRTSDIPSFTSALIFRMKAALFQLRRVARDSSVDRVRRYRKSNRLVDKEALAISSTPLWTNNSHAEIALTAGKIQNLRVAAQKLNGVEVAAGEVFSFWRHIGRPSPWRGFVKGRELRQGCIIPSTGGGLCQLSNALYSAALDAGFEIVERHAHTQVIPGSAAEQGRDATVFWNYVDLRFKSKKPFRIEAFLTGDSLVVRLQGEKTNFAILKQSVVEAAASRSTAHNSCESCGVVSCFRSLPPPTSEARFGKTAFLVDEYWIEFDRFIQARRTNRDSLYLPIDGKRLKKPNYAWSKGGFHNTRHALSVTLRRALAMRHLPAQGGARQRTLLKHDEALARKFASMLTHDVTHLCISQNLLPFLWREGHLGGRTFDVLMTRLPIKALQEHLDLAHRLHPESTTLGDFRADEQLAKAESEALRQAQRIITPHSEIANLYPNKAVVLDWHIPDLNRLPQPGKKILFPASTLGRKGAFELREVARELELELLVAGRELEGEGFWNQVSISRPQPNPLAEVGLVVLPAFVEHQPRRLLQAVACGIPVIASTACGLQNVPGVISIPAGNAEVLSQEIENILFAEQEARIA